MQNKAVGKQILLRTYLIDHSSLLNFSGDCEVKVCVSVVTGLCNYLYVCRLAECKAKLALSLFKLVHDLPMTSDEHRARSGLILHTQPQLAACQSSL